MLDIKFALEEKISYNEAIKRKVMNRGTHDLTNRKFGRLVVKYIAGKDMYNSGSRRIYWWCKCECGNWKIEPSRALVDGSSASCGCLRFENAKLVGQKQKINEVGNKYGKLTVISEAGRDKYRQVLWLCKCDCGNETIVRGSTLRSGGTRSCGCLRLGMLLQ